MGAPRGNAQPDVFRAIDEFWEQNSYPPTIRDIAALTGLSPKSTGTIWMYMNNLAQEGKIIVRNTRPIPLWVDELIKKETEKRHA